MMKKTHRPHLVIAPFALAAAAWAGVASGDGPWDATPTDTHGDSALDNDTHWGAVLPLDDTLGSSTPNIEPFRVTISDGG